MTTRPGKVVFIPETQIQRNEGKWYIDYDDFFWMHHKEAAVVCLLMRQDEFDAAIGEAQGQGRETTKREL